MKAKKLGKIVVGRLKLALRPADERDASFCYELMSHNMRELFNKNTDERWSRAKFKSGFKLERVTLIEHDGMSIGFYDCEIVGDKLYWHNIQLSEDYQRGIGTRIGELIEQTALDKRARVVYGKVFSDNSRIINWLQNLGYRIDERIEQENSYWVKKDLESIK